MKIRKLSLGRWLFLFALFHELLVLARRGFLVAAEEPDEITDIVEAAGEGDFRDGIVRVGELETGHLDAVAVEVVDGAVMRDFLEEAAEVIGREVGRLCEVGECQRLLVLGINELEGLLELRDALAAVLPQGEGGGFVVKALLEDEAEEGVEQSRDDELVARVLFFHAAEEVLYEPRNVRRGGRQIFVDERDVLEDILNPILERMAAGQHLLHVEDDAVVNRVRGFGMTAVHDAVADEDDVTGFCVDLRFIERERHGSPDDEIDLVFHMPVIRHVETRVMAVDVVEFNGEIEAAALTKFVISIVLHMENTLSK